MDSTAQTANPGDWQEEIYQRLKYLKDTYFADLREIHQKLSMMLSQLDSLVAPNARRGDPIEKMKQYKMVLESMMAVLQLGKHSMQIGLKDKLSLYEKQIQSVVQNYKKAPQRRGLMGGRLSLPPLFIVQIELVAEQPYDSSMLDVALSFLEHVAHLLYFVFLLLNP
ncbi:mediator of RNA polymerase II transcription subunit 15a-like [Carex rostrata]